MSNVRVREDPPWQLAPILLVLLQEIDTIWPRRSRLSDGTIGDEAHAARQSDHNPDQYGYVRALDVTKDAQNGPPLDFLAEYLRQIGAAQSQRLTPGGYVIWNCRMVSSASRWKWTTYLGDNPHTAHLHVSCSRLPHHYRGRQSWALQGARERWR